ncbi:hypothetical protein ABZ825_19350 [Streptomyces tauricus]|uniref:hypothetical protein n=1 Tax=Streptomyces tauricus TaxID=68274 RepID=UPI0033D3CD3A
MRGTGRRVLGPDRVDQDPLGDRTTTGERQPYEQSLQPRTRYGQGRSVATGHGRLKRAEQRDAKPRVPVHRPIFARARPNSQPGPDPAPAATAQPRVSRCQRHVSPV